MQDIIGSHLFCNYEINGQGGVIYDHYLYLIMRLFNIPPGDASAFFFELSMKGAPKARRTNDPILDLALSNYEDATGRICDETLIYKSCENTSFNAFCQTTDDGKNTIEIWTGASALCCIVSMAFAQQEALTPHNPPPPSELIDIRLHRLVQGCKTLNSWVEAWKKKGYIFLDRDAPFAIEDEFVGFAQSLFIESIFFILYHELAHHHLGHVSANSISKPSPEQYRQQEFDADRDALEWLRIVTGNELTLAPLVVFLSASLIRDFDDSICTDTHPSLVERINEYHKFLISNASDQDNAAKWIQGYAIPKMRTLLINLHDRDRMPAWFGHSRNEEMDYLQGQVKTKHIKFNEQNRAAICENDLVVFSDSSRPKRKCKILNFKFYITSKPLSKTKEMATSCV